MLGNLLNVAILSALLMASCGNNQPASDQVLKGAIAADPGSIIKFKTFTYIDAQGTGGEAFRFLMPADWQFTGGISWVLDQPMMPATAAFQVNNPQGKEAFEAFANHCYFWTNNQLTMNLFPPGSRYFGSEVKAPVYALDALRDIILPDARRDVSNFRIIESKNLPELVQLLGAGQMGQGYVQSFADGAKIRFTYTEGGANMEEEIYGVVEGISIPIQSMYGTTNNILWYVDYIFSFKAKQGELEKHAKVFQTIVSSFRVNPQWQAKYSNFVEFLAQQQIQRIHNIGEFSRMLSQMSDQMRQENLAQYEARSNMYDRVSQNFGDYMLNINRYYDPYEGREVELPSGYNHVWANNRGEYILIDDPNFNPNVGSNLGWQPLKQSGRGG